MCKFLSISYKDDLIRVLLFTYFRLYFAGAFYWGVASSQALFRGVPLEDICVAAGWSSPHTFVKFYNLEFDTAPGSQILSV